jgi:hypothetical protein
LAKTKFLFYLVANKIRVRRDQPQCANPNTAAHCEPIPIPKRPHHRIQLQDAQRAVGNHGGPKAGGEEGVEDLDHFLAEAAFSVKSI